MLSSLLSLLGGGLLRLLPELILLWNKKTDNSHELAMMDKQLALQQSKSADDRETLQVQGGIEETLKLLDAQKTALDSQMQKTGIWLADLLNFLVRPITTYYFLALHGLAKAAMFYVAIASGISGWDAILKLYTQDDVAILCGILSFWFVGRRFDKQK